MNNAKPSALREATAGAHWTEYQYLAPAKHTLSDLLAPDYFNTCPSLKECDRISFADEPKTMFGILCVTQADHSAAEVRVSLMSGGELEDAYSGPETHGNFGLDFHEHTAWRVIHAGSVVSEGHPTRAMAIQWTETYTPEAA